MSQTNPDARKPDIDIHSEDVAIIGKSIYKKDLRPHMTDADKGKLVVIDVYSGDYEIDFDLIAAQLRLKRRQPDAFFYICRVGYRSTYRMTRIRRAADPRPRQPNP